MSSKGWVKPGETYPFTLRVLNYGATPLDGRDGDGDAAGRDDARATAWDVPTVPPRAPTGRPGSRSRSSRRPRTRSPRTRDRLEEPVRDGDADRRPGTSTDTTRGPKVIPPTGGFETARYGDRPFPVVPVDYSRPRARRRVDRERSSRARSTTRPTRARRSTSTRRSPTGSCSRTRPCRRRRSRPPAGARRRSSSRRPQPQCARNTNATLPTGYKTGNRDQERLVPAAGRHDLLRRRRQGLGADRRADRRRRAAGHRLGLRADRQGGLRRGADRRRRRSTTTPTTPTRTASSTSS